MNKIRHFILPLWGISLVIGWSCANKHTLGMTIKQDSIYNVARIQNMTITQPHEVLALLDTAEQKSLMTPFDINRLRCLAYHNGLSNYKRALRYALEAYKLPSAREDTEVLLSLVELIADEYYMEGDYANSVRYCGEGIKLAQETDNRMSEANLHVTFGQNLLQMRQQKEAFRHFRFAINVAEEEARKSSSWFEWDNYVYALGMTINSLSENNRYEEVIAMRPAYEKAMENLSKCDDNPEGLVDMRLASGYAAYAYIYRQKGNAIEADRLYDLLVSTRYASTLDGEGIRIPYLIASQRYREALHYITREKQYKQAHSDTVNYEYIEWHLKYEQQAYEGMEDFRAANRVQNSIIALMDTLQEKSRQEDALELAEIYKSNEQAQQIERQTASIRLRNVIIISAIVFLLVSIAFSIRMLYYNRTIRNKNNVMIPTIDELMTYKDELFAQQEENIRLKATLQELQDEQSPQILAKEDADSRLMPKLTDNDRTLYNRMIHEITNRRLYRDTSLTKQDLLKEFHIPNNKFSILFKEFAGCSFTQYIQQCRLHHAICLMREHPQWSLEAIAKESQMSNGAFYSQFQKKYGMKPSDYRNKELLKGRIDE